MFSGIVQQYHGGEDQDVIQLPLIYSLHNSTSSMATHQIVTFGYTCTVMLRVQLDFQAWIALVGFAC